MVRTADGSEWRFCLPVRHAWRWRRALTGPTLTVWRHLYCFLGTPLLDPTEPQNTMETLVEAVTEQLPGNLLGLDLVRADGPVLVALQHAIEARGGATIPYETVERAAAHRDDPHKLQINRKHQREVARLGRRLADHLGGEVTVRDRGGEQVAIDQFLDLERSGWKGEAGSALASNQAHQEMFREICRGFATAGRLRMLSLEVDGAVIAMLCNLKAGATLFMFKTAYDEELARFSPGIQLLVASLRSFDHDPGLQTMDSCAEPTNQMINRLWSGRLPLTATAIPASGIGGRGAGLMVKATSRLTGRGR